MNGSHRKRALIALQGERCSNQLESQAIFGGQREKVKRNGRERDKSHKEEHIRGFDGHGEVQVERRELIQ